jgi:predicted acetyltransferase
MPQLVSPTPSVRESYLAGEREMAGEEGASAEWLDDAERDFEAFVARRRVVRVTWGVPVTELWFVDGSAYLGTVVIRHRLTRELWVDGGHIGFHVIPSQRGRGHAKQMLTEALRVVRQLGIERALLTCDVENGPSRRVVEASGGVLEAIENRVARYWL